MRNNTGPAVLQRIQQAKTMWEKLKTNSSQAKITLQIRMLLWNATIRATLTYGLQTRTLTNEQYNKLERFANNCHREIVEPNWILQIKEQQYTSQEQINSKLTQPSIKTWLQKLRLAHHAHQTKASWTIHTQDNETIQETEQIWEKEWENARTMIQQEINKTTKEPKNKLNTYLFRHKSKKTTTKILKLMNKEKQAPKLQELKQSHLETCTFMILKQPQVSKKTGQNDEENTTTNEQQKIHQCVTCKKVLRKQKPSDTQSKQTSLQTNLENRI